ncbi:MAG: HAD family hydrolase [Bacteroidota bacterium]
MNPPQLIIFDCDGVLVDSEAISNHVVAELLTEIGLPTTGEEAVQLFAGTSMTYIRSYFRAQTGKEAPTDFEATYRKITYDAFTKELKAIEGIEEVLGQLKQTRCVASNGPMEKVRFNLKLTGLINYFDDHLFSAYDIQKWKPEPDLYLHAATKMGFAPADCLVIEDSPSGIQAAQRAGIRVLGYAAHAYAEEKLAATDTTVFHHMNQLPDLIKSI